MPPPIGVAWLCGVRGRGVVVQEKPKTEKDKKRKLDDNLQKIEKKIEEREEARSKGAPVSVPKQPRLG